MLTSSLLAFTLIRTTLDCNHRIQGEEGSGGHLTVHRPLDCRPDPELLVDQARAAFEASGSAFDWSLHN
jgi:hypothetical protein